LPQSGVTRLSVYDVHGREVVRLVDRWQPSGIHRARWARDAAPAAAGVYLVRLRSGGSGASHKVVVSR
jgi:hypothetical protein